MRKIRRKTQAGFTLVELIAVMIILGLLAGTVTLAINSTVEKARVRAAITQISSIGSAISTFHLECGFYPAALRDLVSGPSSGRTCKNFPAGGFLQKKEIPVDPWENPYNYVSPGAHNQDSYDISSAGKDGEDGTSDDITSWATEKEE